MRSLREARRIGVYMAGLAALAFGAAGGDDERRVGHEVDAEERALRTGAQW